MANKSCKIVIGYIKNLEFNSPNVPNLFLIKAEGNARVTTNLNLQIDDIEDSRAKDVTLTATVDAHTEKQAIFKTLVAYAAIVNITDNVSRKEDIESLIRLEVLPELYTEIKKIVEDITSKSGFTAVTLPDVSFQLNTSD